MNHLKKKVLSDVDNSTCNHSYSKPPITFQADDARIGYMAEETSHLLRKFLKRFVKAKVIRDTPDLKDIQFECRENQLDDDLLAIGQQTRLFIAENKEDLSPHQLHVFFG